MNIMDKMLNDNKKEIKTLMEQYLKTLNEKELKSYHIAKEHLGMSFQLEKSVGFLKWKSKQEIK